MLARSLSGPADVTVAQVDYARDLVGEAPHVEVLVEEQRGDVRAVEQVLHVALRQREIVELGLQLGIDRLQLLVHRLRFFLGGRQLLVGGLQLLVGGLQLFVGRLQFLLDARISCRSA